MNVIRHVGLSAAAALLLAIGGCGNAGTTQTNAEVRRGASEAAKREAEARMDATYDREQAHKRAAAAQRRDAPGDVTSMRDAAIASAQTTRAAAVLRCDVQTRESQLPCRERADSEFATAKARAEAALPSGNAGS